MKRILSLIVALSLVLAVVPFGVFAADAEEITDISEAITAVLTAENGYECNFVWTATNTDTLTVIPASDNPEGYDITVNDISIFEDDPSANSYSVDVETGKEIYICVYFYYPTETDVSIEFSLSIPDPAGAESNPIWLNPEVENELTIGAGKTVYYQARAGAMIATVTGENFTVAHNGVNYSTANTGSVSFTVYQESMFKPAQFVITNNGSAEATCKVSFAYPVGSSNNPTELVLNKKNVASIEEGNDQGYYFTYIADYTGTLILEFSSDTGNWMYTVNNMTTYVYGDTQRSDSVPVVNPYSIDVTEGDEIQITVSGYDPTGAVSYPTAEITVYATMAGDLNSDGEVNDADVVLLLWHTLFPDRYTLQPDADFNGDKYVNDADVAYLLWHTLFPTTYPLN